MFIDHLDILFCELPNQASLHSFLILTLVLSLSISDLQEEFFIYFEYKFLVGNSFPSLWLVFYPLNGFFW